VSYFLAIRTLVRKLYVKLNYSNVLVLVLVLVVLGLVLVFEIFFLVSFSFSFSFNCSRSCSRHNLVSLTSLVICHIRALHKPRITSKLVRECMEALNELAVYHPPSGLFDLGPRTYWDTGQ